MKTHSGFIWGCLLLMSCSGSAVKEPAPQKEGVKTPKNIILMIADGTGLTHITAGWYANGGVLNYGRFPVTGLVTTHAYDDMITDSAAGATAYATGKKTRNGMLSQSPVDSSDLKTILEYAVENRFKTGIIATCSFTHATPAAFYGHQNRRNFVDESLALQFLESGVNLLMAGGKEHFYKRRDQRNLIKELKEKGYVMIDSLSQPGDWVFSEKLMFMAHNKHQPSIIDGRGDFLPQATDVALKNLNHKNEGGFFIMIEGSQIDWGGHDNRSEYIITELIDFDKAIGKALDFAEKDGNTLVLVVADHETGGYAINEGSLETGIIKPAFTTDYHTGVMVPIFAYGPGSEQFSGIMDNTTVHQKMIRLLGFNQKP
ncbi:MAG: alkaline phosphatase [Flavobacteriales bacterium]